MPAQDRAVSAEEKDAARRGATQHRPPREQGREAGGERGGRGLGAGGISGAARRGLVPHGINARGRRRLRATARRKSRR
uniref:Uncharacterized protein n=1 Tax=Arundo donax TaxID=35708 RepID=A0A0A9CDZ0_ARUDO